MSQSITAVVGARIDRANALLNEINSLRTFATRPERIRVEPVIEDDIARFIGRIIEEPPISLSVLLGEFFYELRASLENLAWHLAENPREGQTGFPVCEREECWASRRTRARYRSIPEKKCELIKSLQPFTYGEEFRAHPLWQLDQFAKRDRHRLITAVAVWNPSITFLALSLPDSMPKVLSLHFEDGQVICLLKLTDWWRNHWDIAELKFHPDLALGADGPGQGKPILSAAQEYIDWVQTSLDSLLA